MNGRLAAIVAAVCLVVVAGVSGFGEAQGTTAAPVKEGQLTGEFLLVNIRSIQAASILKDYELVTIGGKVFLRGIRANIGDDGPREAGIVVNLAVDDIVAIREFTWSQAESYYGSSFREKR